MLIGQYAKLGPLGVWRSFPLARGLVLFWLLFVLWNLIQGMVYFSDIFVYLISVNIVNMELSF